MYNAKVDIFDHRTQYNVAYHDAIVAATVAPCIYATCNQSSQRLR